MLLFGASIVSSLNLFFFGWEIMTPSALGGVDGSVRYLLTETTRVFQLSFAFQDRGSFWNNSANLDRLILIHYCVLTF